MAINWVRFIKRDRGTLLFVGIFFLIAAIVLLFLYFDKVKIKSKDDIAYISGPFEKYSWVSYGGRNGSSLTFKLQNYNNVFKIKADFFSILRRDEFKKIPYGDTLTVGIPKSFMKVLNTQKTPFFVYSIASNRLTYLDLNKVIAKHNSILFIYGAGLFMILGYIFIYFGRKANLKTSIL